MVSYSQKLKHPKWQKKRLEILARDNFMCTCFGDSETELHVHHEKYEQGKDPWDYEAINFRTLCKICHEVTEAIKKWNVKIVKAVNIISKIAHGSFFHIHIDSEGQTSLFMEKEDLKLQYITTFNEKSISKIRRFLNG